MPLVVHLRRSPLLSWARWLLLALGIGCLGFVSYAMADARLFQAYENWQFGRDLKRSDRPASILGSQVPTTSIPFREVPVARGAALGRMEIPRLGVEVIVVEGTDGKSLRRAVGHVIGTPLPGERGNVTIAGHRDTFFRALRNIRLDDEVILTTLGGSYRYQVDSMRIVGAEDNAVLRNSSDSVLTLVTCYPFYLVGPAPQRFIVRAHKL